MKEDIEKKIDCPKCGSNVPVSDTCLRCGYEYRTGEEGVGPFVFAYPAVGTAYKPSGKGSTSGNVSMLIVGIVAGTILGKTIPLALNSLIDVFILINSHHIISEIMGKLKITDVLNLIVLGTPIIYSFIITSILINIAILSRCNDMKTIAIISFISGGTCLITYIIQPNFFIMADTSFVGILTDSIQVTYWVVCLVFLTGYLTVNSLRFKPFCEKCMVYMKKAKLWRIPIKYEKNIMETYHAMYYSKQFEGLNSILENKDAEGKNYCEIKLNYCDSCKENGVISASTIQTRFVKKIKLDINRHRRIVKEPKYSVKKEQRQIFSLILKNKELSIFSQ